MFSIFEAGLVRFRGTQVPQDIELESDDQEMPEAVLQASTASLVYQRLQAAGAFITDKEVIKSTSLAIGVTCTPIGAILVPLGVLPAGPIFVGLGGAGLAIYKVLTPAAAED